MKAINGQLFLTAKETADRFGVSRRTVLNWCSENGSRPQKAPDLQPLRGPSGRFYFRKEYIDALLASFFGDNRALERPSSSGFVSTRQSVLQGT